MGFAKSIRRSLILLSFISIVFNPFVTTLLGNLPMMPSIPAAQAQPFAWMGLEGGTGSTPWIYRANSGGSFTANVSMDPGTFSGGVPVYGWEFKLSWNATLLNLASVTEGNFLKNVSATTFYYEAHEDEVGLDYVLVNCTLNDGAPGATAYDVAVSLVFNVQRSGGSRLNLYDTKMWEKPLTPIEHNIDNGYFVSSDLALVFVTPQKNIYDPVSFFDVFVSIDGVTNLKFFTFRLGWFGPPPLLNASAPIDGGFLTNGFFSSSASLTYVLATSIIIGAFPPVSGSGMLAIVSMGVIDGGNCTLHLYETALKDSSGADIPFVTLDGYFSTHVPRAYYPQPQPAPPITSFAINQSVPFNASASFDPDGGTILSYKWNFGDGNVTTVTTPFISHAFSYPNKTSITYFVTLNVTDSQGESWQTQPNQITLVYRDIAVTKVESSHAMVSPGDPVSVYVTVDNFGSDFDRFNTTAYYVNSTGSVFPINTMTDQLAPHPSSWPPPPTYPPFNKTLTFTWNTTDLSKGIYTVKAEVHVLPGENNVTNNEFVDGTVEVSYNVINYRPEVGGHRFLVIVATNSSLSKERDLLFSRELKEIAINVTGAVGTVGFCNVTIPKRLLWSTSLDQWVVLFGGVPVTPLISENATHTFFNLTYTHAGTSKIEIIGTNAVSVEASFAPSTTKPYVNVPVTFNASASADSYPTGSIVSYKWTVTVANSPSILKNWTETSPVTSYTFTTERIGGNPYNVSLTVTSDSGVQNSTFMILPAFEQFNIAITNIVVSKMSIPVGDTVSLNVTVRNTLSAGAAIKVRVTAYCDDVAIGSLETIPSVGPGLSSNLTFTWVTTGLSLGNHTLRATAEIIGYGTTTDFPAESNIVDNAFTLGEHVQIVKWTSQVVVLLSLNTFTYGSNTKISGQLTPVRSEATVVISVRLVGTNTWVILSKPTTNATGGYSYVWSPTAAGTYELKVNYSGDNITELGQSELKTITVNKAVTSITMSLSADQVEVDSDVAISGHLGPFGKNVTVTILYRLLGGQWSTLWTTVTDFEGNYTYTWTPESTGTYNLKATWAGNANTLSSESDAFTVVVKETTQIDEKPPGIPWDIIAIAAVIAVVVIVLVGVYFFKFRKPKTPK